MPTPEQVSPDDTIRQRIEAFVAQTRHDLYGEYIPATIPLYDGPVEDWTEYAWAEFALALLAVGERDRRQIAQLTEALREWHEIECGCDRPGNPAACICVPIESAAVLADEEDAANGN